jgi:hypothetical protein
VAKSRSLEDRNKDRVESLVGRREIFDRIAKQRVHAKSISQTSATTKPPTPTDAFVPPPAVRTLTLPHILDHQHDDAPLQWQPWAADLVKALLARADDKKLSLRLLWPAEARDFVILHAAASLSRAFERDLQGLRTLYYPGSNATRLALDKVAVDRRQIQTLWKNLWGGGTRSEHLDALRRSAAFESVLTACNDVALYNPEERPPQWRELVPTFNFDPSTSEWQSSRVQPLDRLIRKVAKLARRKDLREAIDRPWRDRFEAPGALFVLPRGTKRKHWKDALTCGRGKCGVAPDVLLIDASARVQNVDSVATKRIPDFLETAYKAIGSRIGALVVTDDPATYFALRTQLTKPDQPLDCAVYAAEGDAAESLFSANAKSVSWAPQLRTPINFTVTILDQDAANLALKFGRIADAMREAGAGLEELFRAAQQFLMRTSHLPGGFLDLLSDDAEEQDYLSRQLEWQRVEGPIAAALQTGVLNTQRGQVEAALVKAHEHIEKCSNGTPLALKLREQVERYALRSTEGLTIIFPSLSDIAVAQRFLDRVLGLKWPQVQTRLECITLRTASETLHSRSEEKRLVVVGLNRSVLRLLMTHKEIPAGTHLLIPVQRAIGVVRTLEGLSATEALKPYKARTSGLRATLQQRLAEVPHLANLTRAFDSQSLTLPRPTSQGTLPSDPRAFRISFEDGRYINVAGFVYRYDAADGTGFTRIQVRSIQPGDLIFDMSDALRDQIEEALGASAGLVGSSPQRKLLLMYHRAVSAGINTLTSASTRQGKVQAIKAKMIELDRASADLSEGKLQYWIDLREDVSAPHGARDHQEFMLFCRALGIEPSSAELYWYSVRATRTQNQTYGRQLAACYAEILFQPESAQVYRAISPAAIPRLQAEATECVFRVVKVEAPDTTSTTT